MNGPKGHVRATAMPSQRCIKFAMTHDCNLKACLHTCKACAALPTVWRMSPLLAAAPALDSACCALARLPAACTTDPIWLMVPCGFGAGPSARQKTNTVSAVDLLLTMVSGDSLHRLHCSRLKSARQGFVPSWKVLELTPPRRSGYIVDGKSEVTHLQVTEVAGEACLGLLAGRG